MKPFLASKLTEGRISAPKAQLAWFKLPPEGSDGMYDLHAALIVSETSVEGLQEFQRLYLSSGFPSPLPQTPIQPSRPVALNSHFLRRSALPRGGRTDYIWSTENFFAAGEGEVERVGVTMVRMVASHTNWVQ